MSAPASSEIDGVWEMVRAECDGETAPELVVRQTTLEFAQGRYRVRFAGQTADSGAFEIGNNSAVGNMLLRGREGTNAGREIACIYQVKGDRLRVCFDFEGVVPTDFKTSRGSSRYLATYGRAKAGGAMGTTPPSSGSRRRTARAHGVDS